MLVVQRSRVVVWYEGAPDLLSDTPTATWRHIYRQFTSTVRGLVLVASPCWFGWLITRLLGQLYPANDLQALDTLDNQHTCWPTSPVNGSLSVVLGINYWVVHHCRLLDGTAILILILRSSCPLGIPVAGLLVSLGPQPAADASYQARLH